MLLAAAAQTNPVVVVAARCQAVGGCAAPSSLEHILHFVPPEDLVSALAVDHFWSGVAISDAVWSCHCNMLWADKMYVPGCYSETGKSHSMSRISAYWHSIADSKRSAITQEELCSFEWSSRMKGWAGTGWTISDPWWQPASPRSGPKPASVRRYHVDGTTTSDRGSGTWRFVLDSCGKTGPEGCFVRLARDGQEFPTHFASRWAPNWGWILQNCWGFSASFPLPPRGKELALEDDGELCQSINVEACRQEAEAFNLGIPLPHSLNSSNDNAQHQANPLVVVEMNGRMIRLPADEFLRLLQGGATESDEEEEASDEEGSGDRQHHVGSPREAFLQPGAHRGYTS